MMFCTAGGGHEGENPTGLEFGAHGNLYGFAALGIDQAGVVFELSRQ